MPGNVRAAPTIDRGTRFKFSIDAVSSFVSALPHFGQRALNNLPFDERLRFILFLPRFVHHGTPAIETFLNFLFRPLLGWLVVTFERAKIILRREMFRRVV